MQTTIIISNATHDIKNEYWSLKTPFCEICPSVMLAKDGTEIRSFRDEYGSDHVIPLQRYYCPICRERYIERPDCFEHGKLYLRSIIERVRSGDKGFELFLQCDPSTIYRWKKG